MLKCINDTGKIIENKLKGDTLFLNLGHFLNCSASDTYLKDFQQYGETINFIVKRPHTLENINGKIVINCAGP